MHVYVCLFSFANALTLITEKNQKCPWQVSTTVCSSERLELTLLHIKIYTYVHAIVKYIYITYISKSHYFITKFIKFNSKCKLVTEEYLASATASDRLLHAHTHTPYLFALLLRLTTNDEAYYWAITGHQNRQRHTTNRQTHRQRDRQAGKPQFARGASNYGVGCAHTNAHIHSNTCKSALNKAH